MRLIVRLYGIYVLLSICLNGKELPKGLTTVSVNANNPEDMSICPKSHIIPRAPVPFKNIDDVRNWVLTFSSCIMYFIKNRNIKYEEMLKYHDKMRIVQDGEKMTFDQIAKKMNIDRHMVRFVSWTINILEFDDYSISLAAKNQIIYEKDLGVGRGERFMTSIGKQEYNEKGGLIYADSYSEKAFLRKILDQPPEKEGATFQNGFGDYIDYFDGINYNQYGIYMKRILVFLFILLLLNLCMLYRLCCSTQKRIKYDKMKGSDIDSSH